MHFATHGFVSSWSERRSALVLAPTAGEDGFLQARELYLLPLRVDLVVLAACSSAAGRPRAGDQARSLAHAFLAGGARSVVAALWDVPDRSTHDLMRDFYTELARGRPRAEALRRAKLASLGRGGQPNTWAALVLVGDGDAPLAEGWRAKPRFGLLWEATGSCAVLLLAAVVWRRSRHRSRPAQKRR